MDDITQDEPDLNVKQSSKIKTGSKKLLRLGDLSKEKNLVRAVPLFSKGHDSSQAVTSKPRLPFKQMESANMVRANKPFLCSPDRPAPSKEKRNLDRDR